MVLKPCLMIKVARVTEILLTKFRRAAQMQGEGLGAGRPRLERPRKLPQ